jgi:hypothetical protein
MLTLLVFLAAYAIIILLPLIVPLTPQVHGMLGSVCASVAESCVISVRKQGDAGAS